MTTNEQPDHLPLLDAAWNRFFQQRDPGAPLDPSFVSMSLIFELAEALVDHVHSEESRQAIAQLFFCDRISRVDRAAVPDRHGELSAQSLGDDVLAADVKTLLWFVGRQTEGVDPSPDMGGLSSGPPSSESFALYDLRVCAMRCLHHLLSSEEGRKAVRNSSARDRVLRTSIGWCEHAFYSQERAWAVEFKAFAESELQ